MQISSQTLYLAQYFRQIAMEELVPRHYHGDMGQETRHTDGSFVTEADLASEKRLIEVAKITHPHALATGEEQIAEDPRAFLKDAKNKDVWIFDPLDGTGAFREGRDIYAIMGAYVRNGVTEAGIIYAPGKAVQNADGTFTPQQDMTIMVERGRGCWMVKGMNLKHPVRLQVADHRAGLTSAARVAFACRNQDASYQDRLTAGLPHVLPRWHANHDYIRILTNQADATFYAEGFMPNGVGKCPPWDHAAGVLAIQEAGGYVALPYGDVGRGGQEYDPLVCHSSLLVATNRRLFDQMMAHIKQRAPELCEPR